MRNVILVVGLDLGPEAAVVLQPLPRRCPRTPAPPTAASLASVGLTVGLSHAPHAVGE